MNLRTHAPKTSADGRTICCGLRSGEARALVETLPRLFCTVPDRARA
jgi:hypothetical protein